MKRDVLITLRGTQVYQDEAPQTVELVTRGIMREREGKYSLSYEETELTGTAGVTTTFFIPNGKRVVLSRDGAVRSKMVFQEGVKDESLYEMGFGALLVGVLAKNVQVDLGPRGGKLVIDYVVEIEGATNSHNAYELLVEPLNKEETPCEEPTGP